MLSRLIRRAMLCLLIMSGVMVSGCGGDSGESSDVTEVTTDSVTQLPGDPTAGATVTAEATDARGPEPTARPEPSETTEVVSPVAPDTTATVPAPTPGPTPTIPPVPTQLPPPPPMTVTGTGTTTSTPVQLPVGVAVVTMNHSGTENFKVRLQTADLEVNRPIGEGTGIWKGSTGVVIRDAGEYLFWVQADSDWQIDVMWPTPETAPVMEVPFNYSGTGDQAVYFILVQTGQHSLSITHDGVGAFSVHLITREGRGYIDKVSGVGPSSASREFVIRDKAFEFFMLNVQASGNWTIQIE